MSTVRDAAKAIQQILGVSPDGDIGPRTREAFDALDALPLDAEWPQTGQQVHKVKASSFADPADIAAFKRCKASGLSDQQCFRVGDNGIGKWGDDCTVNTPICALPPEMWQEFGDSARGKKVLVTGNKASVVCELRDTMPHLEHIHNGAGIDLNEAACHALGMRPPMMLDGATWQWV